jgi:hypothetical protein
MTAAAGPIAANKLPFQVERTILAIKREHPSWGAPKIREKLIRQVPIIKPPAASTIHAVLDRKGLVKRRKHRRHKAQATSSRQHMPLMGCGAPRRRLTVR